MPPRIIGSVSLHIDIADVRTAEDKLHLYAGIDRTSTFAFVQLVTKANRVTASAFPPRYADGPTATYMTHMFDMRCEKGRIEYRLTKIKHPWTNGQVERMNRTIKDGDCMESPSNATTMTVTGSSKLTSTTSSTPIIMGGG